MRPVAYRRGWVADAAPGAATAAIEAQRGKQGLFPEAPSPPSTSSGPRLELESLEFAPDLDGSWTLKIPIFEDVGVFSGPPELDQGEAELRLRFRSDDGDELLEVISLPWPSGTTADQVTRCTARLHRKRGELVVTLPPSLASASSIPERKLSAQGVSGGATPNNGSDAVGTSIVAASAQTLDPAPDYHPQSHHPSAVAAADPPQNKNSSPDTPDSLQKESQRADHLHPPEIAPATSSTACDADSSETSAVVPDDVSAKVDDFRRQLANQPQKALSFQKDGKTMREVDVDPEAMDLAAALMLHSAAATGNLELIKRLVDAKTDPNVSDETGTTPLEKACLSSSIDAVELLLQLGASAKALAGAPSSPLHRAAAHGNAEGERLVRLLLEKRANPTYMDQDGRTAADTLRSLAGSSAVGSLRILRLLGA